MSELTPNLKLFKYNTETDAKQPFSINDCMNANWDKIDASLGSLEICDIGMALYVDETKGKRRYLNGQIVERNANTEAFFTRLKEITTLHPSLLCTEEEWQTAKTMSAFGQVGKFVFNYSGGEIVSVRLPRVVNVQGLFDLQNLGMTVSAGLPNINGGFTSRGIENVNMNGWGAFNAQNSGDGRSYGHDRGQGGGFNFDASRSNPIYGKSNTVQQEAIQYPYFIQIATGSETKNNIINEIELNTPSFFGDSKYVPTAVNNLSWLKSEGQNNPKGTYPSFCDWILENVNKGVDTFKTNSSYCYKKQDSDYGVWTNSVSPVVGMSVYGHTPMQQIGTISALVENGFTYYDTKLKADTTVYRYTSADNRADYITDYDFVINTTDETFRLPLKNHTADDSIEGLTLYFYVGETVQNAKLIDAGRFGEVLATKTDMQQASGAGMPSGKYIDLTLGASGSTYTAPANGWLQCACTGTAGSTFFELTNNYISCCASYNGGWGRASMPVSKGMVITVYYGGNNFTKQLFRFTYAEGSK